MAGACHHGSKRKLRPERETDRSATKPQEKQPMSIQDHRFLRRHRQRGRRDRPRPAVRPRRRRGRRSPTSATRKSPTATARRSPSSEAQELLERGAELLGDPNAARHVVTDRSTPEGLAALAEREGADVIVFCSDSHTAKGHVSIGNSAQRLLEGGRTAIAIAPVDLAESAGSRHPADRRRRRRRRRRPATAESLAGALTRPSRRSPTTRPTCS